MGAENADKEDRPWDDMNVLQKTVFLVKLCIFLVSGGFIFPKLF